MLIRQWLTARIKIIEYCDDFGDESKDIYYRVDDMRKGTMEKLLQKFKDGTYDMYFPHESFVMSESDELETVKFINWTIPDQDYTPRRLRKHYRQFLSDFADLEPHFPYLKECVIRDLQWFLKEPWPKHTDYNVYRQPPRKIPRIYRVSRKTLKRLGIESRPAPEEELPM